MTIRMVKVSVYMQKVFLETLLPIFIATGVDRFGSRVVRAAVRLPDLNLKTLGERGIECIFVGYAEHSKAFRFSLVPRPRQRSLKDRTEDSGGSVVSERVTEEKESINDEMYSIMGNNTWVLTDLPPGCRPIVARISTSRLVIAMASIHNMIIYRMDVKTSFLNEELEEEVDLTKEFLSSRFSMEDMEEADVILGIRIKHESNVSTLLDTYEKLMPNKGPVVSQLKYSRVIGYLMYAMTCIRPNIVFAVGKLSRYTSNPGTQHWQAIQRELKYLKKTLDYRLVYSGYPLVLKGYTDASWISKTKDNSSTSGWVFLLGGGVISWVSKKQTCITGSTMKSEFMALAAIGKEAEWLKNLILEIPLWVKPMAPISIHL
nr:zinc finger, CCHC-type [Tanacetum cinerariifolium]